MLGLIGIKKGIDVSIREKLVISPRTKDLISNSLKNIPDEFVTLSTCNRTEICCTVLHDRSKPRSRYSQSEYKRNPCPRCTYYGDKGEPLNRGHRLWRPTCELVKELCLGL